MKSTNVINRKHGLRNILTSLALAVLVSFTATAQDDTDTSTGSSIVPGTFNFGGRAGVTFGYFNGPGYVNDRRDLRGATKKGIQIGGFFTYHLTEWLSATGELNFMQTGDADRPFYREYGGGLMDDGDGGFVTAPSLGSSSGTSNITLNHIDIPLMVEVRPPFLESINPFLKFGPSFGFNMTAVETKSGVLSGGATGNSTPFISTDRRSSEFSELDFGLNFGVGTKMVLPGAPFDLVLEGRYRMGMNNINRSAGTDYSVNMPNIANTNTLMILLGFEF